MAEGDFFGRLLRLSFILSILLILAKCICVMTRAKRGRIPPELRPLVENLHLEARRRVKTVSRYGGLFHRVVGRAKTLSRKAVA